MRQQLLNFFFHFRCRFLVWDPYNIQAALGNTMDQKTWLWRKKSSEKAIVTTDKINSSLKGNEEEVIHLLFCSLIISLLLILLQNWVVDVLQNASLFKFIAEWVPQYRILIKPLGSLHWHVNMFKSSALAISV